jgi:hypothetical protein
MYFKEKKYFSKCQMIKFESCLLIPMQLVYFLMISPLQHKYDYPPVDWSLQYKLWYLSMHWLLHHKIRVSPNETRIKKYDVDFANWVSDIKKKTQNSLIASKSSFYFKHSLNDRRRLSLNQKFLLSERISRDCYCRHLQTPSKH